ncbi:MAG: hypothetical protein FWG52_09950 [Proteobacteria bacterium]|nr:hypothetical protein [Pseudomonadota bacterium]
MLIYTYDPATGEYLNEAAAQESPLEPGKPLLMGNATQEAPPEASPGTVACWTGSAWELREDHRRSKRWSIKDGSPVTVEKIGLLAEAAPDTTDKEPPEVPRGHKLKWASKKWALVEPDPADVIRWKIDDIEATITPRRMREASLGIDGGWLAARDEEIAALRAQM